MIWLFDIEIIIKGAAHLLSRVVVYEEGMRPSHWLGVNALIFLQCLDTIGRVTGRASGPSKPVSFVPKDYLLEETEEENSGSNQLT